MDRGNYCPQDKKTFVRHPDLAAHRKVATYFCLNRALMADFGSVWVRVFHPESLCMGFASDPVRSAMGSRGAGTRRAPRSPRPGVSRCRAPAAPARGSLWPGDGAAAAGPGRAWRCPVQAAAGPPPDREQKESCHVNILADFNLLLSSFFPSLCMKSASSPLHCQMKLLYNTSSSV